MRTTVVLRYAVGADADQSGGHCDRVGVVLSRGEMRMRRSATSMPSSSFPTRGQDVPRRRGCLPSEGDLGGLSVGNGYGLGRGEANRAGRTGAFIYIRIIV